MGENEAKKEQKEAYLRKPCFIEGMAGWVSSGRGRLIMIPEVRTARTFGGRTAGR